MLSNEKKLKISISTAPENKILKHAMIQHQPRKCLNFCQMSSSKSSEFVCPSIEVRLLQFWSETIKQLRKCTGFPEPLENDTFLFGSVPTPQVQLGLSSQNIQKQQNQLNGALNTPW